jgi:phosphoribosylamine--glycine ligase
VSDGVFKWSNDATACVVMASGGYPGAYEAGKVIAGLDAAAATPGVTVFHAGTAKKDGHIVTAGGRVLGVTARAANLREAVDRAYQAVNAIHFEGAHFRRDIAHRGLKQK